MRIREFLKANKLKQRELAYYLGVTEAAISNVAKGKSSFSEENLIKILNNPHGWDVSMLTENQPENAAEEKPCLMAEQKPALSNVELLLWNQLAEKDAKIDTLNEIIWELKEEIGRLKGELTSAHKGGAVQNADSSSCASVG